MVKKICKQKDIDKHMNATMEKIGLTLLKKFTY